MWTRPILVRWGRGANRLLRLNGTIHKMNKVRFLKKKVKITMIRDPL